MVDSRSSLVDNVVVLNTVVNLNTYFSLVIKMHRDKRIPFIVMFKKRTSLLVDNVVMLNTIVNLNIHFSLVIKMHWDKGIPFIVMF